MLRLCRLTDPPKTGRKDNLTVQKLPEFCEDIALRREVKHCVNTAIEAADFARPWRNQRISHADLDRATTANVEPLAPATLQQVAAAFDAVHAVLITISVRLLNEEIGNHVVVRPRARAFLCYAKQLVESVHQGAVSEKHLDYYLDEFTFRFNRRRSRARGLLFYRLLQNAVQVDPVPYRRLVGGSSRSDPNM